MRKTTTLEAAHGRWREIMPMFMSHKLLDGKHHPCPACGGKDRFRFHDRNNDGDYYCSHCGPGKGVSLISKVNNIDYAEAANRVDAIVGNLPATPEPRQTPKKRDTRDESERLWRSSRPVSKNDPVSLYLVKRGIQTDCSDIRYVPQMYHVESRSSYPGMIAMVRDVNGNGTPMLHRTYLTLDGDKAQISPCRKLMSGTFPKGGSIRLSDPASHMGVAEGIETALSASAIYHIPVWSTISEAILQMWEPPSIAKHIVIFGDNDENFVGQQASYTLAKRLRHDYESTIEIEVAIPNQAGDDWNDVLLRRVELSHARAA